MRLPSRRSRLPALLVGLAAVLPLALAGSAAAVPHAGSHAAGVKGSAIHGTIRGFATGDFAFLNALSVPKLGLTQATIGQSAAGVSTTSLQTTDTLGQDLLAAKRPEAGAAYARGAAVSLNLGRPDSAVPQAGMTQAEAVSPPRNSMTTKPVTGLALPPVASVDAQPDTAAVNTLSHNDFCVLGRPLSEGTSSLASTAVLPMASSAAVASSGGAIRDDSVEQLEPNGAGALGLSSVATLTTAGLTLFNGVPGAATTVKVINPLVLRVFAGGVSGSARVTYGGNDGGQDALSITAGGKTTMLTAAQVFSGSGVVMPVGSKKLHLFNLTIGGKPSMTMAPDGRTASAVADLLSVQIVNQQGPTGTTIGGSLAPVVTPVLAPVVKALDRFTGRIRPMVSRLGLKPGVDVRIGHLEASAQVPHGGISCGLPVTDTTGKDPVESGERFTVAIRADNPYDCVARHVQVHDTLAATRGVAWTMGATGPTADKVAGRHVVWNDIGSIQPGDHRDVLLGLSISPGSATGQISDTAHVTASCSTTPGSGSSTVKLVGDVTLHAPQVNPSASPAADRLPDTGMSSMLPVGGGVLLAIGLGIAALRRRTL